MTQELFWMGDVDEANCFQVISTIHEIYHEKPREKIQLIIVSPGGSLEVAFSFYDYVCSQDINIVTVGCGLVHSAAMILLAAGKKRAATENTSFLIHPAVFTFHNNDDCSSTELEDLLDRQKMMSERMCQVLSRGSVRRKRRLQALDMKESYFFANKALQLGLIDKIVPNRKRV